MLRSGLNDDSLHPFAYARILKILHIDVRYDGPGATRTTSRWQPLEVLWVRWFELDHTYNAGFQHRRLPRVQFVDAQHSDVLPFGFIDPQDVIRASYLMPAFDHGETNNLLHQSMLARWPQDEGADFLYYYVCMFVDRDMYIRYLGGGVGHREQSVTIATSRQHAERIKPIPTQYYREGTAGCRVTGVQVDIDSEDSDDDFDYTVYDMDSDKSDDDSPDSDSDSGQHGYGSDRSAGSGGSMAEFYGHTQHKEVLEHDDLDPSSSEDEHDLAAEAGDDPEQLEMAGDVDVMMEEDGQDAEDSVHGNIEQDEDYLLDEVYEEEGYARL